MKFNIPKIIRPLEMVDYDDAMEGLALQVWVNPPRGIRNENWDFQLELLKLSSELKEITKQEEPDDKKIARLDKKIATLNKELYVWFARLWSQAKDPDTHVAVEEIEAMTEEDPAIWGFMTNGTLELIRDHAENVRKN